MACSKQVKKKSSKEWNKTLEKIKLRIETDKKVEEMEVHQLKDLLSKLLQLSLDSKEIKQLKNLTFEELYKQVLLSKHQQVKKKNKISVKEFIYCDSFYPLNNLKYFDVFEFSSITCGIDECKAIIVGIPYWMEHIHECHVHYKVVNDNSYQRFVFVFFILIFFYIFFCFF